ncbi:hypothetical protein SDC9_191584 [bioreactor metagenome]|uniref:Xylulose kinase n=1 Tax=bioreactor metagenome TaxID=1076179 RepID=A0A645I9C6_9ZZZZ
MLAGVASGVFASFEDSVASCVKQESVILPVPEHRAIYTRGFRVYRQIHDALAPVYKTIASQS